MTFNSNLLHYFLEDALRGYSEDFQVLDTSNPVRFELNGRKYSANISYIHDSGENRPDDNEARIQITANRRETQRRYQAQGYIVCFLGFYEGAKGEVFAGWEPDDVFATSATNRTHYGQKSHQDIAKSRGAAIDTRHSKNINRLTTTISLPSHALGVYLENLELFHQIEDAEELRSFFCDLPEITEKLVPASKPKEIEYTFTQKGKREKKDIILNRKGYVRDANFSKQVMQAYNGACAVCQKQLGIVQAAHIVPHHHDDCVETVNNGIALCVEHHALYDSALLLPYIDRKLYLNENRVQFLTQIGRTQGLDEVRKRAENEYTIPSDNKLWPQKEFLELGLNIRLGKGG